MYKTVTEKQGEISLVSFWPEAASSGCLCKSRKCRNLQDGERGNGVGRNSREIQTAPNQNKS